MSFDLAQMNPSHLRDIANEVRMMAKDVRYATSVHDRRRLEAAASHLDAASLCFVDMKNPPDCLEYTRDTK